MDPRLRSALTLGTLSLLVLLGAVWGWNAFTAPLPSLGGDEPTAPCTPRPVAKGDRVVPTDVVVSIYNTSTTEGLASKVMTELARRGFESGELGNARDAKVSQIEIRTADPANPAVQLLAAQFGGRAKVVKTDEPPMGPGVVVLVGAFDALGPHRKGVVARADSEICSPPPQTE